MCAAIGAPSSGLLRVAPSSSSSPLLSPASQLPGQLPRSWELGRTLLDLRIQQRSSPSPPSSEDLPGAHAPERWARDAREPWRDAVLSCRRERGAVSSALLARSWMDAGERLLPGGSVSESGLSEQFQRRTLLLGNEQNIFVCFGATLGSAQGLFWAMLGRRGVDIGAGH